MSIQPPPTNTTTPVYNPIFYVNPTANNGIDVAFLDANYLKFPTAQGSEDFTNGLFSTDTIDFNSATGANRAITNLSTSSFTDVLGNASYTASIEENSTAIGIYDGGLVLTSSNSINLVGTNILANGVPVGTSVGGNVSNNQSNTFQPTFTQTFQGSIVVDNTQSNIGQFATNNTGIGFEVLNALSTGDFNSAFGYQALNTLTTGTYNTGLGYQSLASITTGEFNIGVGAISLPLSLLDNNNTSIGYASGYNLNGDGTNSDGNTFLGYRAGFNQTSGSNNVAIGLSAGVDASTPTISNTIAIGNITAVAPLDIILGSSSINYIKFYNNTDHYELTSTYNTTGTTITDLYVNGFAQQPSTSTPSYLPNDYGTFYNSGGLPYFAYNNAGTISSQQLAYQPSTFTLTATPNSNGNTYWIMTPTLTQTLNANSFTFTFYTNITNTTITTSSSSLQPSGNYIAGTGTAILQNYIPATGSPTLYNGYIFTIVNSNGLSMTTTTSLIPSPLSQFRVTDADYFYTNNVNLIFNCIKIN